MKEHDIKLTLQETEQLCRLYMDCRLTVLEETELQYVLGKVPYSSPRIDEVRMLMGISLPMNVKESPKRRLGRLSRIATLRIAASVTILFAAGVALFHNGHGIQGSPLPLDENHVYIAAYSHGKRLNGGEAESATNIAMAKADSLMKYASLTERDYMMKANDIISETINK